MKIYIKGLVMICGFFTASIRLSAQTVMSVANGSNVYIQQNTNISFDSLVLTPSTNVLLTANNITKSATVTHVATGNYISRVYSFSSPVMDYSGSITIVYNDNELNGLDENNLVLDAYNNNSWQAFTTNVSRNTTENFVTTNGITNIGLDELTLAGSNSVLPLQWISVEASRGNNVTYIKWTTANEVTCKYYQVQKSNDATAWSNIGNTIAASNHAALNDYSLIDATLLYSTTYYRILQMDVNGKMSYSSIVSIKDNGKDEISVFPIPAVSVINVRANNNTTIKRIKLFDAGGKLLMVKEGSNNALYSFAISNLSSGIYLLSIEANNGKTTKSFMKK